MHGRGAISRRGKRVTRALWVLLALLCIAASPVCQAAFVSRDGLDPNLYREERLTVAVVEVTSYRVKREGRRERRADGSTLIIRSIWDVDVEVLRHVYGPALPSDALDGIEYTNEWVNNSWPDLGSNPVGRRLLLAWEDGRVLGGGSVLQLSVLEEGEAPWPTIGTTLPAVVSGPHDPLVGKVFQLIQAVRSQNDKEPSQEVQRLLRDISYLDSRRSDTGSGLAVELRPCPKDKSLFNRNPVIVRFTNTTNKPISILRPLDGSLWCWHRPYYKLEVQDADRRGLDLAARCGVSGLWADTKWPDDYMVDLFPGESFEKELGIHHPIPADGEYTVTFSYIYFSDATKAETRTYPSGLWQGTARSKPITFRLNSNASENHGGMPALDALHDSPAFRATIQWHRAGKSAEIRMSWFLHGSPGIAMLCSADLMKHEVMTVREVYDWASQSLKRRGLDDAQVLMLRDLGNTLPRSTQPKAVQNIVIVSAGAAGDRCLNVYDRRSLPREIRRLYDLTGAYIVTDEEYQLDAAPEAEPRR